MYSYHRKTPRSRSGRCSCLRNRTVKDSERAVKISAQRVCSQHRGLPNSISTLLLELLLTDRCTSPGRLGTIRSVPGCFASLGVTLPGAHGCSRTVAVAVAVAVLWLWLWLWL